MENKERIIFDFIIKKLDIKYKTECLYKTLEASFYFTLENKPIVFLLIEFLNFLNQKGFYFRGKFIKKHFVDSCYIYEIYYRLLKPKRNVLKKIIIYLGFNENNLNL